MKWARRKQSGERTSGQTTLVVTREVKKKGKMKMNMSDVAEWKL